MAPLFPEETSREPHQPRSPARAGRHAEHAGPELLSRGPESPVSLRDAHGRGRLRAGAAAPRRDGRGGRGRARRAGGPGRQESPTLRAFDSAGRRVDEVVFHPAYHAMERIAFSRFGLAALSHHDGVLGWPGRVPQTVKYALSYLFAQSEFGLLCPVNMTDSTARMLEHYGSPELKAAVDSAADHHGLRSAPPGNPVDDREDGRLRCGRRDHHRAQGRRRGSGACGATSGSAPMPTRTWRSPWRGRKGARGHPRPRHVPRAQAPARRCQERLDHQSPQGQVRLALHGLGRGDLRGRRGLCRRARWATASSR
jgi:hypothetical protein